MTRVHVSSDVSIEQLSNGLTVLVETIPDVESVAYELTMPGGLVTDQAGVEGSSLILAELTSRGAGSYNSRALSDAFDARGIRHSEAAGSDRFSFRGTLLSEPLEEALRLTALMVREPLLPAGDVENIKSVLLQDLASLTDNPARRALVELVARYYPGPYARSALGTEAGIRACHASQQRDEWARRFGPRGAILSVAGKCQPSQVLTLAQRYFESWSGSNDAIPKFGKLPTHHYDHVPYDSAQLQVALAYPSAPFGHTGYFPAKVATQILSGGMFGRLFIEVREKRGLCYSVYARHSCTKEYGTIMGYAGTTPERAQETLEVMVAELRRLADGVSPEELSRAKANLKASLVMGEESSSARASSNAQDYWLDKRVRSLDEIIASINQVSADAIRELNESFPLNSYMLVTLGSRPLNVGTVHGSTGTVS